MKILNDFFQILFFTGDLTPRLFLLMWVLLFLVFCGITYIDERKNQKQYKYYKNNIYTQWRIFKK